MSQMKFLGLAMAGLLVSAPALATHEGAGTVDPTLSLTAIKVAAETTDQTKKMMGTEDSANHEGTSHEDNSSEDSQDDSGDDHGDDSSDDSGDDHGDDSSGDDSSGDDSSGDDSGGDDGGHDD